MKSFDTATVDYAERTEYWREAISRTFIPLDCTFATNDRKGSIVSGCWGDLHISEINCSAQHVLRGHKGAQHQPDNVVLLSFVSQGRTDVIQAGQQAKLSQGQFALYDTRYPYQLHLNDDSQQHVVQIPLQHLQQRFGRVDPLVARVFGKQHQLMPYLHKLLLNYMTLPDELPTKYAAMLYDQFLGLLTSIMADEYHAEKQRSIGYSGLLFQIKIMIDRQLSDPELSAAGVAEYFKISTRYLGMLFQKDGTSFGRYLLAQRLERSALALQSGLNHHASVSDIAWRCGFTDMSYFSREFKAKFGCSPTEYRHQEPALIKI